MDGGGITAAIAAAQAIRNTIDAAANRKYVLWSQRASVDSGLTVLWTLSQHGALPPNLMQNLNGELRHLRQAVNNVVAVSYFVYLCRADAFRAEIKHHIDSVGYQMICIQTYLHSQGRIGMNPAQVQAVTSIRQLIARFPPENPPPANHAGNEALVVAIDPNILPWDFPERLHEHGLPEDERILNENVRKFILAPPPARRYVPPLVWLTIVLVVLLSASGGIAAYLLGQKANPSKAISRIPSRAPTSNPNTAPIVITASPSTAATPLESSSTLAAVLERGYLSVGITNQEGFGRKEEGHWVGFEVDVGRAVSAATFGKEAFSEGRDSEPVKFFPVEATDRFILLANGTIDVLLGTTSDTMERSINEVSSS